MLTLHVNASPNRFKHSCLYKNVLKVANFNESEQLVAACRVNPETSEVVYRVSILKLYVMFWKTGC